MALNRLIQFKAMRVIEQGNDTSIGTAKTLNPPAGANAIVLQALGQNIRYTLLTSLTPTASFGLQLEAGKKELIDLDGTTVIKVIEETGGGSIEFVWGEF